jgi:hypothetical protein
LEHQIWYWLYMLLVWPWSRLRNYFNVPVLTGETQKSAEAKQCLGLGGVTKQKGLLPHTHTHTNDTRFSLMCAHTFVRTYTHILYKHTHAILGHHRGNQWGFKSQNTQGGRGLGCLATGLLMSKQCERHQSGVLLSATMSLVLSVPRLQLVSGMLQPNSRADRHDLAYISETHLTVTHSL